MAGLFDTKHLRKVDKATLEELRREFVSPEYCEQCYNKLPNAFPMAHKQVAMLGKEQLREVMHACAWYIYLNRDSMTGNNAKVDTADLSSLLKTPIELGFDEQTKELTRNTNGLGFANSFIKEKLLSVTVANKGPKSVLDRIQNVEFLYKVVVKTLGFGSDLALTRLLGAMKMVDGQSVSNFRPLSSAYIMYKYGILNNPQKSELTFYIPSEGWLGRLISSYYLAYKFPEKMINYISTDPSGDVVESFHEMVEWLMNYGRGIKNWNPQIRQHGSDVEEANFFEKEGLKYDLSWTSPPYGFQEEYKDSYNLTMIDGNRETEMITLSEEKVLEGIKVKNLHSGDKITHNGKEWTLKSKRKLGQSHSKASSSYGWNEHFFRPTMKNISSCLYDTGLVVWNVANVRTHKTLEDDVVRITEEEGFQLIDTIKYSLQRVPGGILQPDGNRISLRDLKANYEPAFIFKRG